MATTNKLPQRLFYLVILLLFLPMIQAKFELFKIAPLGGYAPKANDIAMKGDVWASTTYQTNKEKYLKENFGFSNWLIRAEHQWAFSAYGMSRVNGLIIGKENYLYEIAYINSHNGIDYLGEKRLVELAQKTKAVQDTLAKLGKAFFFVTAPSKADFYPEYLPDEYVIPTQNIASNYKTFSKELNSKGVHHIDVNDWFLKMKDTSSIPLYSKTGIHYSTYGAALTAKKIIAKTEQLLSKDLPDLNWDKINWNDKLTGSDDDLEQALNLVWKIPNRKLAYPSVYINQKDKHQPRAITIGDSFYWQLMQIGMREKVFNDGQFWYYNKEAYPGKRNFGEVNYAEELNKAEVVFIIMTPPNMKKFLGPFVEHLHDFYFNSENMSLSYDALIEEKIKEVYSNKEWLEVIKKKAIEQNVPLEKMIYLDAKYMVDNQ